MAEVSLTEFLQQLDSDMAIIENSLSERDRQIVEAKKNEYAAVSDLAKTKWNSYKELKSKQQKAETAHQTASREFKESSLKIKEVADNKEAVVAVWQKMMEKHEAELSTAATLNEINSEIILLIEKTLGGENEEKEFRKSLFDKVNIARQKYQEACQKQQAL